MPNERKVHKKPMPRLGGLAIFLSFMFGYMLFAPFYHPVKKRQFQVFQSRQVKYS